MNEKTIDPFQPPVTVKAGQIQFVEACHPPLTAGCYQVHMSQVIKETQESEILLNSDPYSAESGFFVDAPRFTLDPTEIHSVYPPANEKGSFDNALPHVVFTRRTLPWERTLDGSPPELGKKMLPWMALLLVEEDELVILDENSNKTDKSYESRPLPIFSEKEDSLLNPVSESGNANILVPDIGQHTKADEKDPDKKFRAEKWQREKFLYVEDEIQKDKKRKTTCMAIDLPAELVKNIAPRSEDLFYLAHVRQIDTGNKEVLKINDKGWFSLVIGNRVPQVNKSHRAFLVSLEGFQDRLNEGWKPEIGQLMRLAVLGTWRFTCGESNNFKTNMDLLNFDHENPPNPDIREKLPDSWLRLPFNENYKDSKMDAENIVQGAYSRGYTACNHVLRQGEQTVSWYRGPLVPLNYDKPQQIQELVSCSDELLRYDPDTGIFDTAYSAAWQLGRLLALQNQSFALALGRARKTLRERAERIMHQAALIARFKQLDLSGTEFIEDSLMKKIANGTGKDLQDSIPGKE